MSEMRQQGGSASGRLEASRQSLGVVLRGVVGIFVLERQPQGGGSMRPMRYGVPAGNAGLQSRLGGAHFTYSADSAWTVGRTIRVAVRRVMMPEICRTLRRSRRPPSVLSAEAVRDSLAPCLVGAQPPTAAAQLSVSRISRNHYVS